MSVRAQVLKSVLKSLDLQIPNSFDERLLVQKAVYLCQVRGINLGYQFSWYVRGPYSTTLADTYYDLVKYGDLVPEAGLTDSEASALDEVQRRYIATRPPNCDLPRWLELIVSLHFLVHAPLPADKSEASVVQELLKRKSWLHNFRDQMGQAWVCLA